MNRKLALKTASYGAIHVIVATAIAYLLTGDFTAAAGIGLLEPVVQTGVFAIHERLWDGVPAASRIADDGADRSRVGACCPRLDELIGNYAGERARAA